MGQPVYCSAASAGMWGDRGYGDGSSSIVLLPWLPGFPPQALSTTISCLTSPRSVLPQSTAALTLKLLHNPGAPASSCCALQGTCFPVRGMYGCGKDCLILIPFRLPQITCFTLSLKCFFSVSRQLPQCGDQTPASVSPPAEGSFCPTNTPVFPPSSFVLPSVCMLLYTLFQWSSTPVCSQLLFCKHFCV